MVTCLGAKNFRWPKELSGGLEATKHTGGLVKAQPVADPKGKDKWLLAQVHELETGDLKPIHGRVGESSNYVGCTRMEDFSALGAKTNMERVRSFSMLDPNSSKVVSSVITSSDVEEMHGEALLSSRVTGDMLVTLAITTMESPVLKNGSQSHRHQCMNQNRFPPLFELDNEMGTKFGEGDDQDEVFSEYHEVVVQPRLMDTIGFSQNDSELLFLPWDNNGADNYGGGSGVKDNCLLECNPWSRWDPNILGEVVMVQDDARGAQVAKTEPNSSWVSLLMKDFCTMVGFPIVKHEAQCLALFCLLEQECLKVIDDRVPK
nr:hypothetical protein CFP56_72947 [Quercus suber]